MTDNSEPTAWEDINPPTALAPRHEQPISCSENLRPATSETFKIELTACLALVVPVGMTEEGRREWLAVAWETLKHLPPDILHRGCEVARQTCDHPSKIVPAIIAETKEIMEWRRESARGPEPIDRPPQLPEPDRCTPEEARKILESFGLKSSFPSNR